MDAEAAGYPRAPLLVVASVAVALLAVGVALGAGGSSPSSSTPSADLNGLSISSLAVSLELTGHRAAVQDALTTDVAGAARVSGLTDCEMDPPTFTAAPVPWGLQCAVTGSFTAASLGELERLPHVEAIRAHTAHGSTNLYFLGVVRGEAALVVQPRGGEARALTVLAVLRSLPGTISCRWSGPEGFPVGAGGTIACAERSPRAATAAGQIASHLDVASTESIASL